MVQISWMRIPITDAKGQLAERATRRAILDAARKSAALKATPGPDAARSQDFLYGNDGLPAPNDATQTRDLKTAS